MSYREVKGVMMSREGVMTSREGVMTSREGVMKSREGVMKSREGVMMSREGVMMSREGVMTSCGGVTTSQEVVRLPDVVVKGWHVATSWKGDLDLLPWANSTRGEEIVGLVGEEWSEDIPGDLMSGGE